jgi:hypothetical protein
LIINNNIHTNTGDVTCGNKDSNKEIVDRDAFSSVFMEWREIDFSDLVFIGENVCIIIIHMMDACVWF